jgi:hypothetical protein
VAAVGLASPHPPCGHYAERAQFLGLFVAGALGEEAVACHAAPRHLRRFHAECSDREAAICPLDELLLLEIPDVEVEVLLRAVQQALQLDVADGRVPDAAAALDLEQREQSIAEDTVVRDDVALRGLACQAPLGGAPLLVVEIVFGSPFRLTQHAVGLDEPVESLAVARLLVVRMEALREVTKHPVDGVRVGVRADLEDLVEVYEGLVAHPWLPMAFGRPRLALRHSGRPA